MNSDATDKNQNPSVTFVCCIEAGQMENQVILLAESLRKWGRAFNQVPIVAVKPRFGVPIRKSTLKALSELGIRFIDKRIFHRYPWFNFVNKGVALALAERIATTEFIAFLDSDVLIIAEPQELSLPVGIDFSALPEDYYFAVRGPEDSNWEYWKQACKVLNLSIDSLPLIKGAMIEKTIKIYFNNGVFVYRRDTFLGETFLKYTMRLLDAKIASQKYGIYHTDQVALTLAVAAANPHISFKGLDLSHNYFMNKRVPSRISLDGVRNARIIHYFDSLWPDYFGVFLEYFKEMRPDVYKWLIAHGPLRNDLPIHFKAFNKMIRVWRGLKYRGFEKRCKIF